ncbi:MAG: tRNA pseudouridine(55) synthase TruB [Oscillospiraceae bacterium]|nr:tRNA pseudouridine(55) synthase TruB [Oscillospiraceae bacterium]
MNGILLIDKEPGWTSSDVVVKLKGLLRERRIGHAGTLDPMATGLLTVFVGRATRAVQFAEHDAKRYLASLRLGVTTDTQDITGNILETKPVQITEDDLENVLRTFRGEIEQIPPMYSAVQIGGRRLYDIARKGGTVERAPRPVTIHELKLLGREGEDWLLDVRCSKGTYIRTLCHDIGQRLGCGGCMSALRRTEAGGFSVADAVTVGEMQRLKDEGRAGERLLPVDTLFSRETACTANGEEERRIRCGNEYKTALPDGVYRVYGESGAFLMLGRAEAGVMKTIKSFFEV